MAYTFFEDRYGSDFETEEDRRRREEEQKKLGQTEVGSTTEKTYMDGSKTITQTREIPSQQTVMRPGQGGQFMRPVMRGPVNPDDFQRIQQIESGGRQFTPQGQVVTSPKGAMGISQIMPRTAMDPGYGVPNIFDLAQSRGIQVQNRDEATARQLLSNQELNTEFGRNYFNKMNQMYGPEAGAAAYNAGPGRVQQALQRSQQTGQPLQQFLPQETQQYLQRFGQGRGPISPEQLQQQQQQQQQQPRQGILALPSVGAGAEGVAGEQEAQQRLGMYQTQFEKNQNDIDALIALQKDTNAPLNFRNLANERATELLTTERNKRQAQDEAEKIKNDPKKIADVLKSDPEDEKGNWLKFLLLGFISPQAAGLEAARLGLIPSTYQRSVIQNTDGTTKSVQLKMRADGKVLGGVDMEGNTLSSADLDKALSGLSAKDTQVEAGTYMDPSGKVAGSFVLERRPGGSVYRQVGTNRIATLEESNALRKVGVGGTLSDQRAKLLQEAGIKAQGKSYDATFQILQPYNQQLAAQGLPTIRPEDIGVFPPGSVQAQQAQTPQQQAQGVSTTTGVAQTPAQAVTRPTGTQIKAQEQQSNQLVKVLDEEIRPQGQVGDTIVGVRNNQLEMFRRPGVNMANIFGIASGAGRSPSDQSWTIVRDILTGKIATNNDGTAMSPEQMSQRLAKLGLNDKEQNVIYEYNVQNAKLLGTTLKETAGPGSVSNAEQQLNKQRQVDITNAPALGAYNQIYQSKFDGDKSRYKANWASENQGQFKSTLDLDKAWRKEQKRLNDIYINAAKKRLDFIEKNGGTSNVDAIQKAYIRYPVPEFDVSTGQWNKTLLLD